MKSTVHDWDKVVVLAGIVEVARDMVNPCYAALGVLNSTGYRTQSVTADLDASQWELIGDTPKRRRRRRAATDCHTGRG